MNEPLQQIKDVKEITRLRMLIVMNFLIFIVKDFGAKKFACWKENPVKFYIMSSAFVLDSRSLSLDVNEA